MAADLTAVPSVEAHRETLDKALEAIRTREYWSPYPEHPKAYADGETAQAAFDALRGTRFDLDQPGTDGWTGGEVSPTASTWAWNTRTRTSTCSSPR